MKNRKSYLGFMIALFFAGSLPTIHAQFSGDFDPANWTFNSVTPGGDGSVDASGAPGSIVLYGSDNGDGSAWGDWYEEYFITIPGDPCKGGMISFDYNHVNPDIDDAWFAVNGTDFFITDAGSGSISEIYVEPGDVFAFRVYNYDNWLGRGVLTISNFSYEVLPIIPDTVYLPEIETQCSYTITMTPTATDTNCVTLTGTTDPLTYDTQGTHIIEWTFENGIDTIIQTQTLIIDDTDPPSITCPGDIVQWNGATECNSVVTYTPPIGTDNCSGSVTELIAGLGTGAAFPVGITTETYRVTDAGGNTATCSFTVTIWDVEDPVITCPENISVDNEPGACGATVTYPTPTATDNCTVKSIDRIEGPESGSFFPVGETIITYVALDNPGQSDTCSFTVTVVDVEDPVITCTGDTVVTNDPGECGAIVTYTAPVATDNCPDPEVTLIEGLGSGAFFPVGETTEVYVAMDDAGNTDTCSFTVTVLDEELPVITCPDNFELDLDSNTCSMNVDYLPVLVTDNCPGADAEMIAGLASGSVFPAGITTITFVATDAAGNTDTCSFTVTLNDTVAPFIVCPEDTVICFGEHIDLIPDISDNCSAEPSYTLTGATTGSGQGLVQSELLAEGVTTVMYTATDASGNTASCSFEVTVKNAYEETLTPEICEGDSYTMPDGSTETVAGTYTFSYPLGNGCDSTIIVELTVITVNVGVTQAGTTLRANENGAEYQWLDCGASNAPISGETGQSFTPSVTGSYAVSVTADGCTDVSDCYTVTIEGLQGENLTDNILIYPNPVRDYVTVDLGEVHPSLNVNVLNLNGEVVYEYDETNVQILNYDLHELSPGTYFLRINSDDKYVMLRFNKE
jgi:hypothetical protein